jgi:hypothetical protein
VTETILTGALVAWMVVAGFVRAPGGFLSWPMFSRGRFTVVPLIGTRAGKTVPINIYDFVAPGNFQISPAELQRIVAFLGERYDRIDGVGQLLGPRGEWRIAVKDGRVVL